jgi:hypothetical protein
VTLRCDIPSVLRFVSALNRYQGQYDMQNPKERI